MLGIQTLESRRKMYNVMFIRDILCNDIDCSELLSLVQIYAPSRPMRMRQLIFEIPHSTNYGQREPISHCCKHFNFFYNELDLCMSRYQFKSILINLLQNSV